MTLWLYIVMFGVFFVVWKLNFTVAVTMRRPELISTLFWQWQLWSELVYFPLNITWSNRALLSFGCCQLHFCLSIWSFLVVTMHMLFTSQRSTSLLPMTIEVSFNGLKVCIWLVQFRRWLLLAANLILLVIQLLVLLLWQSIDGVYFMPRASKFAKSSKSSTNIL